MTDGGRPTCTDPTCNDAAEYAYWMPDRGDFSRARAPENSDLEDGDLCPYVCASCRDWRLANGRYNAEQFIDPRERLATDGGIDTPGDGMERPSTCENPDADCYRKPTKMVSWAEDYTADNPRFKGWLCGPCLAAVKRGTRISPNELEERTLHTGGGR